MYRHVYLCKLLLVLLVRAAAGTELTVDLSNDCDQEHARKKLHFMPQIPCTHSVKLSPKGRHFYCQSENNVAF